MKYLLIFLSLLLFSCDNKKQDQHAAHENCDSDHEGHDHSSHEEHDDHEDHDHSSHEGHDDHPAHASETDEQKLSPQSIKNMGVKVKAAKLASYTITSPITALITEDPLNERPVYAPFAGRIQAITLKNAQEVKAGESLITIIRAPIQRPQLSLIQGILTPASEEYHNSLSTLRSTVRSLELLKTELKRLEQYKGDANGLALVPQKDIIDLQYSISKADQELSNNRSKLKFHGLTEKEISQVEQGKELNRTPNLWLNAMRQNNIWNQKSTKLLEALPKEQQKNRWVIATIGELSAEELISQELIQFFGQDKTASKHFLDIASMVQQGHTLTDVKHLHKLGAFEKIIHVRAPENNWDLEEIHVKVGQSVSTGEKLLTLTNPEEMLLQAHPSGSEIEILNKAISLNSSVSASPLIKGSSIDLKDLKITKTVHDADGHSTVLIPVKNSLLKRQEHAGKFYRNWNLRPGLRFNLQIPINELDDVFVLPAEAIVEHGADKVVFTRKGQTYLRRKVVILYQNSDTAVLSNKSELRPGDAVVTHGAFALQLALIAGTPQAVDPHAGHNH